MFPPCRYCLARSVLHGRNSSGTLRYRCLSCQKTFSERRRTIGNRYLPFETTSLVAKLLVHGNSMTSTAHIAEIQENTVASLLTEIGEGCQTFLKTRVRNIDVSHLEVDEIWSFVYKKQKQVKDEDPSTYGDAYTFIAIDRATKLVVAWLLGKRDFEHTSHFAWRIRHATSREPFQISADGWESYEPALWKALGNRVSFGRIIKVSRPGRVEAVFGNPDVSKIETTFIERFNGTLRQWCRRFTRKGYAHSKNWEMLRRALALHFAHYNFCRVHHTLKTTPAVAAGLAAHPWTMDDLMEAACC